MIDNTNEDEFADIPNLPSDESIQADLLKTGGIEHWDPFGSGPREPTDFTSLSEETANRITEARLAAGPGPRGTPWQHAVHEQWKRKADLQREGERILTELEEGRGFDPDTGVKIPLVQSPEKRKAMSYRLEQISEEIDRISGPAGQAKLQKEMAKAVHAMKVRHKQAYIQSEAKRRAHFSATEAAIQRAAEGYGKSLPKP